MNNGGLILEIKNRKKEHIEICLNEFVNGTTIKNGFEKYQFIHNALPEISFDSINLETEVFYKKIKTPLLISSMTGGIEESAKINKNLAIVAEKRGWTMGLGSMRPYLENIDLRDGFEIREQAPNIPIIANIGAVQLNYGVTYLDCINLVNLVQADAIVLHLNSLQEVIQSNGDTNFEGLYSKISNLRNKIDVPIGVKEVGWGIDTKTAQKLYDIGIDFIDVAGAGGTSWTKVESFRTTDSLKKELSKPFDDWGIPTCQSLVDISKLNLYNHLIASGGINNGVEVAKAINLGAKQVGLGRALLKNAIDSIDSIDFQMSVIEEQLKLTMFSIGVQNLNELKNSDRLKLN